MSVYQPSPGFGTITDKDFCEYPTKLYLSWTNGTVCASEAYIEYAIEPITTDIIGYWACFDTQKQLSYTGHLFASVGSTGRVYLKNFEETFYPYAICSALVPPSGKMLAYIDYYRVRLVSQI